MEYFKQTQKDFFAGFKVGRFLMRQRLVVKEPIIPNMPIGRVSSLGTSRGLFVLDGR